MFSGSHHLHALILGKEAAARPRREEGARRARREPQKNGGQGEEGEEGADLGADGEDGPQQAVAEAARGKGLGELHEGG